MTGVYKDQIQSFSDELLRFLNRFEVKVSRLDKEFSEEFFGVLKVISEYEETKETEPDY